MSRAAGPVGVFTTDAALVVQSWDRWIADATGIDEDAARGRGLAELFPELESRGLLGRLRRVADSGEVAVLAPAFHEYLLPCPPRTASTRFAHMQQHVTLAPVRVDGAIGGVVVTIEDVTARRERERDLAEQLQSADEGVRLHAVRELAESSVAGPLVGALGDQSWRVRMAAAEGLARERDDTAIEALVAALRERHRDPAVLNAALTALVRASRDVVPALLPLMDSSDADVRTYAALALGLLEDRRAVPRLVRALGDDDANVRFHAIEALGRVASREAALPVASVAETRDFSVAFAALDTLARIGEPSVAPRLVPLLDDPLLQSAAVDALGALGSADVTAPLARMLEQADAPVPAVAVALATLDARHRTITAESDLVAELARASIPKAGGPALVRAMTQAGDAERPAIARVLGWLEDDGTESVLAEALAHAAGRDVAADALVSRGARAVAPLLSVLTSESDAAQDDEGDHQARRAAAATLGRLGATSAVPALIAQLDGAPDVAVVAAAALGHIGDRRAFAPLLDQLDHPHAALRQVAIAALNSLGHPELGARIPGLVADPSPLVREAAARLAGYVGDPLLLEPVLALTADADERVRRAATEQLPRFDDPRAQTALAEALAHGSAGVRASAARALMHADPADAFDRLTAACADPDPWVRYYAARSLGHFRRPQAGPVLVGLALHDAVPPVRIAAVEAVATLGDPQFLDALRPLADDDDPALAAPALRALGGARDDASLETLIRALEHDDDSRRLAALAALRLRAEPASVSAVAEAARHASDPDETAHALDVLAAIDDEHAVSALVELARVPRRTAAVVAVLGALPEARVAWLRPALTDPDVHVRCAMIEALGQMRHRAASALLAEALHDDAPIVRAAAAHALARLDLRASTG